MNPHHHVQAQTEELSRLCPYCTSLSSQSGIPSLVRGGTEPVKWLQKENDSSSKCLNTVPVGSRQISDHRKSGNPRWREADYMEVHFARIPVQLPLHCGKGGLRPERLRGWQRAVMRHLCHHTQISQGPPPAGFNCQALGIAPGSVSQAVQLHRRLGRAGRRAAGAALRPLPLEFPKRADEPPWVLLAPRSRGSPGDYS